jgi:hypothetical protein
VTVGTSDGFARTASSPSLPFLDWSRPSDPPWHVVLDVPDERSHDAVLSALRARLIGRVVHAYGGLAVGCPPASLRTYPATAGARVHAIARDRDAFARVWTGAMTGWGSDMARSFFALDPVRVVVEEPDTAPFSTGGTNLPASGPCPAIVLADRQVSVTLTTHQPPALTGDPYKDRALRVGMTRNDVLWRFGFPTEFGDRDTLLTKPVWTYDNFPPDAFTVTFRRDRVVSFTTPQGLP